MAEGVEQYLAEAPEAARPWLTELWEHVRTQSPELELTMFRGVPMFKFADSYLKGYVMLTAAKTHLAVHAIDFDLIEQAKQAIPGAKGGKGNVAISYPKLPDAVPQLKVLIDQVLERHGFTG